MTRSGTSGQDRAVTVILHGATGRLGANQHLVRSLLAIRADGGICLPDGSHVVPEPLLAGRDAAKLEALARRHGVARWTTDLDSALGDPRNEIFFDAASTGQRGPLVRRARRHVPEGCVGQGVGGVVADQTPQCLNHALFRHPPRQQVRPLRGGVSILVDELQALEQGQR